HGCARENTVRKVEGGEEENTGSCKRQRRLTQRVGRRVRRFPDLWQKPAGVTTGGAVCWQSQRQVCGKQHTSNRHQGRPNLRLSSSLVRREAGGRRRTPLL
ncbi:unnamed protein product, partial [Ectocarpus sp. 12 AP-2014]